MISHELQCVFIHIPKTGGTSVEKSLGLFEDLQGHRQDHRTIAQIQPAGSRNGLLKRMLEPLQKEVASAEPGQLSARQYHAYFKFTFVRNPWTRAVSWYRNVLSDPRHLEKHGVSPDCSFPDFMIKHGDLWALRPQLHWIQDRDGKIPLDFLGRFERFDEDFRKVCDHLKLEHRPLAKERVRAGDSVSYRDYYDAATRELVAERYAEEIDRFGYQFEDLES